MGEQHISFNIQYLISFLYWLEDFGESDSDISDSMLKTDFVCLEYSELFKKGDVQLQYNLLTTLHSLFPTVMVVAFVPTQIKSNIFSKWKLLRAGVPFRINTSDVVELKSYMISPLAFYLQLASALIERTGKIANSTCLNSFQDLYEYYKYSGNKISVVNFQETPTSAYLNQNLGSNHSRGELIDFIDRLFDQYKHTKITFDNFRNIFYCFGNKTEDIGNMAFDLYTVTRQTDKSWDSAIVKFLNNYYRFSETFSSNISTKIYK